MQQVLVTSMPIGLLHCSSSLSGRHRPSQVPMEVTLLVKVAINRPIAYIIHSADNVF